VLSPLVPQTLRQVNTHSPFSSNPSLSLWMYALLQCVTTWLQAQGITRPIAVTSGAAALLHPLLNWLFIRPCGLGAIGSAVATALTQAIWLTLLIVYILWYGVAAQKGLAWPSQRELRQALRRDPWPFLQVRDEDGIGGVW
jgi:Na+-driven multidrug efflux pump